MTSAVVKASEEWLTVRLDALHRQLRNFPNDTLILQKIRDIKAVLSFQKVGDLRFPQYWDVNQKEKAITI